MNPNDPRYRDAIEREWQKRQRLQSTQVDLLANSFPEQAAFVRDPSKRKATLGTRRSGKTFAFIIMLLETALAKPGSESLYLSYNRDKARTTITKPLTAFLKSVGLIAQLHKVENRLYLSNGSTILMRGIDKPEEIEKLRGEPYPLSILDECQREALRPHLRYIVDDVLEPTVAQYDGTIVLGGTPGLILDGLFYDVTAPIPKEQGWSFHPLHWEDNTTVFDGRRLCDSQRKVLQARLERDPDYLNSDGYKREWQGEWVVPLDRLCYHFDENKNLIEYLPHSTDYNYILGIDPAHRDGTAFVLAAYKEYDQTCYIVESKKIKSLNYTDVANIIRDYQRRYPNIISYVIDGATPMATSELRNIHGIPLKHTPKKPNYKFDAINIMNGDFALSKIKVIAHQNQDLIKEWRTLTWDENHPTRENQNQPNDLCDAALYAYRESKHWTMQPQQHPTHDPTEAPQRYFPILASDPDDNIFDQLETLDIINKLK